MQEAFKATEFVITLRKCETTVLTR